MSDDRNNFLNSIIEEVKECRHQLHQNPGTAYEEFFASDLIARKLTEWGIPFERGWAETGIVATIEGQPSDTNKSIALRGDIDALDIVEETGKPYASKIPGKMHACGHDGHTAILLGTAKFLNETRNFKGKVHLIFQPAEEGGGGAMRMIDEGIFEKYPVDSIYGMHNWPWLPKGIIATAPGPIMACSDDVDITITGIGGHAAYPHSCVDPVVVASEIVMALQTIVSRNIDPADPAVVSITNFNAGTGGRNIISNEARLKGTARAFKQDVRNLIEKRIKEIVATIAQSHGAKGEVVYRRKYEPTINDATQTAFCAEVARSLIGSENVITNAPPVMGAEDFGAFLTKKPGCYIALGQGMPDPDSPHNHGLHSPKYDFNDAIIPDAIRYFVAVTEKALA